MEKIDRLKNEIENADVIVIGAGAGLSTSAGFIYTGERFSSHFADFEQKYGFHDMYTGGFYPFKTLEEHWAYWSRYIYYNRYVDPPKPTYSALLRLVRDLDYFVITTNVDHCFQKAGFDKKRLFYTQGDYGLFQCSEPCCQETFENEEIIRAMLKLQKDMRVPSELLPACPHCGKILYLELGVGYNTPGIVKFSFWRMTAENPRAVYACVNLGEAYAPKRSVDQIPRSSAALQI